MINTLLILGIVIVVLLVVAKVVAKSLVQGKMQQTDAPVYEALPTLLTAAERSFFGVLQQAIASDYQIFAKVRLADIVRPVRNPSRSGWQSAFNRITGKHVDFVLCDKERISVVAVIELDDRTHERLDRGIRDNLVDAALTDAAIPILRISARQNYSPAQIRERVQSVFVSSKKVGGSTASK